MKLNDFKDIQIDIQQELISVFEISSTQAMTDAGNIVKYAISTYPEYIDEQTDEVNATGLAEDVFNYYQLDEDTGLPEEWADDDTNPIWDLAAAISNKYEEEADDGEDNY